jgi:hypothetical protein
VGARALADLVVVVHLAFILFVGLGALLAWRWPRLVWLHVPAALYGIAIIAVGFDCPLTPLEKHFRRLAGDAGYEGGFVDRYLEGVVYPGDATPVLQALGAVAVVVGYGGLAWRRRRASTPPATAPNTT